MTAVFCPALSDSAGRRVVNHRILGTGQGEREQLLSATLPAIREPALAHGHGHTREAAARRSASCDCKRDPQPRTPGTRTGAQSVPAAPAERCCGCQGPGGKGKPRSVPGRAPEPAPRPPPALPLMLVRDTHPENFSAEQRLPD